MAYPVRKQIYLDHRLEQLLKEKAMRTGHSQAEIIRQALEQSLMPATEAKVPALWLQLKDFFQERARMPVTQKGRRWKREELYEEHRVKPGRNW